MIVGTQPQPEDRDFRPPYRSYAFRNINCILGSDIMITLLEYSFYASYNINNCSHARVRCIERQRVKNVTATLRVNTTVTTTNTVKITWDQNTTVAEPTMFVVICGNDRQITVMTVSNDTTATDLGGFLSSSNYSCCVSAVYNLYTARSVCMVVETTTNNNSQPITREHSTEGSDRMCITGTEFLVENSTDNIPIPHTGSNTSSTTIGGVLGFIIVLLLVLLAVSVVCLLRPGIREELLHTK